MSETPGGQMRVVIVGAGLAGDRCAFALRSAGFSGAITLVGAEDVRPYDRPPLSKKVLGIEGEEEGIFFRVEGEYADNGIELRLGRIVESIDRNSKNLALAGSEKIPYDILVLATGSRLRELPELPRNSPFVHYLRDRKDAIELRAALDRGGRVAVVGGGVIGLEAAAAAAVRELEVTVIEPESRVMARACGPKVSEILERRHEEAGVTFCCNCRLEKAERNSTGYVLGLSDGRTIEAEVVIVGIGVVANTELATDAGLTVSPGGILVDGRGQTSDPAIFAAGEVALCRSPIDGRHERQENWFHAAAHGDHVGRSIAGSEEEYAEVPSFWSDQYDLTLQSVGRASADGGTVREIGMGDHVVVYYLDGSRLVGASGFNSPREIRKAKALIESGGKAGFEALSESRDGTVKETG